MSDLPSNKELLKLLKKGDMLAFDAIYNQYSRRLYGFVLRYIKRDEDAEEIVQDVFLKIWKARGSIDVYSSFDSFLFTVAYNSTISLLRKRMSEKKYLEHLNHKFKINLAPDLIDEIHFNELNEKINSLLEKLTPRQKEIFKLSRYEGLSHKEIAEKLDISTSTVKQHLMAALTFLKTNINNSLIINILFIHLFLQ